MYLDMKASDSYRYTSSKSIDIFTEIDEKLQLENEVLSISKASIKF